MVLLSASPMPASADPHPVPRPRIISAIHDWAIAIAVIAVTPGRCDQTAHGVPAAGVPVIAAVIPVGGNAQADSDGNACRISWNCCAGRQSAGQQCTEGDFSEALHVRLLCFSL